VVNPNSNNPQITDLYREISRYSKVMNYKLNVDSIVNEIWEKEEKNNEL
jgi:hypothetical protein